MNIFDTCRILNACLTLPEAPYRELLDASLAVKIQSPIAETRVARVLTRCRRLAEGDLLRDIDAILDGLDSAPRRGRLPEERETATAQIQLRVEPSRKTAWVRYAQEHGGLSATITRLMDQAAGYQPPN